MRRITRTLATAGCFLAAQFCMAAIPAAPSRLMATADSQTEITLSWTDNSGDESGFKIERSPDGIGSWSQVGTVGANVETWTDDGLSANALWYYRVRAWNGDGDSNNSNTANAHTAYATEYGGTPVWKALLLVYEDTDVDYEEGGVPKHYTGSMSTANRDEAVWAFYQYLSLVNELSDRECVAVGDVVYVPNPITSVTDLGSDDYWVAPSDIESDIDTYAPEGDYDSILVNWHPGDIPHSALGLAFGPDSMANGATYCQIYEWGGWDAEGKDGEAWLHEWGHGMSDHMETMGHLMPYKNMDGKEDHGYTGENWEYYYDLFRDKVWDVYQTPAQYTGTPVQGWRQGGPANHRAEVQGDWFYMNSLSRYENTGMVAWAGSQNNYNIVLGIAPAADNRMYTPLRLTDSFQLRGSVSVPVSGAGSHDSVALAFRGGSDEWWATVEYGTGLTEQLSLFKSEVRQATFPLAIGAGWYTIELDVDYAADTVRMKAWPRNENEPADWQLSAALGSDWTADEIGFRHYGQGTRVDDLVAMTEIVGGAFTEVTGTGLPGVSNGSAVWGDYDNDGDLDLLLVGYGNSGDIGAIYRNNGDGTFTDINAGLPAVHNAVAVWGDYDNDGDLDLFIAGSSDTYGRIARVYRNDGSDTFVHVASFDGVFAAAAAWGDYDNDGDLDLIYSGLANSGRVTHLFRNDGNDTFTQVSGTGLTAVWRGDIAWGDYDNDGYLDLVLTGNSANGSVAGIFRNNGDGTFSDIGAGLQGVDYRAAVAWGDYDNDGDLDLFLCGYFGDERYAIIYRNNGDGTFSDIHAGLGGIADAGAAWGDFDNDGDLDLACAGLGSGVGIWRNDGGDTFSYYPNALTDVRDASVSWGDYDGDGRLDLLISGKDGSDTHRTQLWRNNAAFSANTVPAAPTNLNAVPGGDNTSVTLSWGAASDSETATNGLTYNLRVGTTSGGDDVLSAMADLSTGLRRLPAPGNANHGLSYTLTGFYLNAAYYWSVQAIDTAFAGGAWATEGTFSVTGVPAITTYAVSNVTTSTAQCGGEAPDTGGAPILAKGLVWHTAANPTVTSHTGITDHGGGFGSFQDTLSGLTSGQTYYVRAYASNSVYMAYGEERRFNVRMPGAGNALRFDGSSDYVQVDDDDSLDLTSTYTLECWFKPESFGLLRGLISKYQTASADGYFIRLNGTELDFDGLSTSSMNLQAGTWYHVAAVNDNGTRSLYVNGSAVALSGTALIVKANDNPLRLGSDFNGRYFHGTLDDVRIWNTARTEGDILDNMHRPLSADADGLVALYRFDCLSGTVLPDETGHGLDGTLVSGPSWQTSTFPCAAEISGNLNLRGAWNARTASFPSSLLTVQDSDVTPDQYIVTGHDGGALTANTVDRPATIMWRLNRVWRMETADSPAGNVHMDCSGLAGLITQNEALRLLVDADGTFLDADILPGSFADDTLTVNGHTFQSGAYYTLAEVDTSGIETWYVDVARPHDNGDGSSWGTAKRSIQAAVNLAGDGDTVLVADGLYDEGGALVPGGTLSNRVAITKDILVRSVNGPGATVIAGILSGGSNGADAVRCVYLTGGGTLSGFTLYRGYTHESGADDHKCGGGVYIDGGTVTNCVINHCSAHYGGGLAIAYAGGLAVDCEIRLNTSSGWAGGVLLLGTDGVIDRCVIKENEAGTRGGGLYLYHGGVLRNSLVSENWSAGDGGGIFFDSGGAARNCTVTKNFTTSGGNGGGIAFFDVQGEVVNSIVSGNFVSGTGLNYHNVPAGGVTYTCTTPALDGEGNINEPPDFMSSTDYHLHPISQCIDSGTNRTDLARDLDGIPRPLDGNNDGTATVDMGCYEFINRDADSDGDGMPDGFELDHGLDPTDPDDADANADNDPHSNLEEYIADTDPNDPADYFRITAISNGPPWTVIFTSSSDRVYTLLGCTNLTDGTWIAVPGTGPRLGSGGADHMTDTNEPPAGPFYRLRVNLP